MAVSQRKSIGIAIVFGHARTRIIEITAITFDRIRIRRCATVRTVRIVRANAQGTLSLSKPQGRLRLPPRLPRSPKRDSRC